jgi:hypothetical protein
MGAAPQMGHFPSSRITAPMLRLEALGMPSREAFRRCPCGQIAWIFNAIVASYVAALVGGLFIFLIRKNLFVDFQLLNEAPQPGGAETVILRGYAGCGPAQKWMWVSSPANANKFGVANGPYSKREWSLSGPGLA